MPDFNRSSYFNERRFVYRQFGTERRGHVFTAHSIREALEVASLIQAAYQRGREEQTAELAELAKAHGGLELIGRQLLGASKPQNCATEYPHPSHNWERGTRISFRCPGVKSGQDQPEGAPAWNCVSAPLAGPHFLRPDGSCRWCDKPPTTDTAQGQATRQSAGDPDWHGGA